MTAGGPGDRHAGMQPSDIGRLAGVAEVAAAWDGYSVACTVNAVDLAANQYRSAIWLSRGDQPATQITTGEHRDCRPRWSPDGRLLAFVSHREADGDPDKPGCELYLLAADGPGEARCIARWPEEIEELNWSPDGSQLAFTARMRDEDRYAPERDRDRPPVRITRLRSRLDTVGWITDRPCQLFVLPADGSAPPRALTEGPWQVQGVSWSPDGEWLAFSSGRHETWDLDYACDLWRVPAAGGELVQLTTTGLSYGYPSWSPSGDRLAFIVANQRIAGSHPQVGVLDLQRGTIEEWTRSIDRACAPYGAARPPIWADDELLFAVEDGGANHIYAASGPGRLRQIVGGTLQVKSFDVGADTLAYAAATATEPSELFVGPLSDTQKSSRRTSSGAPLLEACDLIEPERFVVTTGDGAEVEAWMMRPAGFVEGQRYPMLLNIHGGPLTQYGYTLFDEFQFQVGAGYVVLFCNPRGSSGYSEAWGRAIRWPGATEHPGSGWGGVDYDDLMAVVDHALATYPFIDPDRLGVLGGSYGGYMTSWMVSHTNRFKAACSERAVNNLLTEEGTSDIGGFFAEYVGTTYLEDPDAYWDHSPLKYASAITTPLLIIHSERDLRCPVSQADELFVALRLLGREVEFIRFPGESHELSRSGAPRHRVQRAEIILDWFDRHLR